MKSNEELYVKYIGLMHRPGNWFQMLKHLVHVTKSAVDALVLSFLMGMAERVNSKKHEMPIIEWFYCKSKTLQSQLLLTQGQQLRILTRLKEKSFIEMTKRGIPPKRYIKINLVEIARAIDNLC